MRNENETFDCHLEIYAVNFTYVNVRLYCTMANPEK